jgi:DNA-binding beta-propeller fold protein YncE
LVADSMDVIKEGDILKMVPDNKVYVIDLRSNPPKHAGTVTVGRQPSGLSFSPSGALALVANSADRSISVLEVGGMPEAVAFTPDGKYLLIGNYLDQDISILKVDGTAITDTGKRFKLPGHPAPFGMSKQ